MEYRGVFALSLHSIKNELFSDSYGTFNNNTVRIAGSEDFNQNLKYNYKYKSVESVLFDVHLRINKQFPDGVLHAKFLFVKLNDLTDIENVSPSCHQTTIMLSCNYSKLTMDRISAFITPLRHLFHRPKSTFKPNGLKTDTFSEFWKIQGHFRFN